MIQRDIDFIIFFTLGSSIGAILHDSGLSIWLTAPAGFVVASLVIAPSIIWRWLQPRTRRDGDQDGR